MCAQSVRVELLVPVRVPPAPCRRAARPAPREIGAGRGSAGDATAIFSCFPSREVPVTTGPGGGEPGVELTQKRAHRRRRSRKGRCRMDMSRSLPIPKARWDGKERKAIVAAEKRVGDAPGWLPRGCSSARRVGSSFQSSVLLLSTIAHWAVTYVQLPVGAKSH